MFDHMERREREREMKGQGGNEEVTNATQRGRKEAKIGASGCNSPVCPTASVEMGVFVGAAGRRAQKLAFTDRSQRAFFI